MDNLIRFLEVIIWPCTILIIIFWFKDQFKSVFNRLNKFDASASGISMSFSEKLEQAKQKAINLSKSGGLSKSGPNIQPKIETEQLKKVKAQETELRSQLIEKAKSANIDSAGLSLTELSNALKERGQLQFEKAELINMFSDLARSADKNLTSSQLNDITLIYETIRNQ